MSPCEISHCRPGACPGNQQCRSNPSPHTGEGGHRPISGSTVSGAVTVRGNASVERSRQGPFSQPGTVTGSSVEEFACLMAYHVAMNCVCQGIDFKNEIISQNPSHINAGKNLRLRSSDSRRMDQEVWTIRVVFSHGNPKFETRNSKHIQKIHHPDRQTVRGF